MSGVSTSPRRTLRTRATRPGPGSFRLLAWLGRLGIAGIEPLTLGLRLHERTVHSKVERLARVGMVARVRGTDGEGGVVIVTRAGARAALESGAVGIVSPRSTAPTSARHGRAVSWVAASAELRGWGWLGPAELRGDPRWLRRAWVSNEMGAPKSRRSSRAVPMRTLQELMGHRSLETTLIYADYAPSGQELAWAEAAFSMETRPALVD